LGSTRSQAFTGCPAKSRLGLHPALDATSSHIRNQSVRSWHTCNSCESPLILLQFERHSIRNTYSVRKSLHSPVPNQKDNESSHADCLAMDGRDAPLSLIRSKRVASLPPSSASVRVGRIHQASTNDSAHWYAPETNVLLRNECAMGYCSMDTPRLDG